MGGSNEQGIRKEMDKEIKTLEQDKDAWDVVKREPWMNVLPYTWAFELNNYQTGHFRSSMHSSVFRATNKCKM
jgi:hypothetical protein